MYLNNVTLTGFLGGDASQGPSQRLKTIFVEFWEEMLKADPLEATFIGDHRYDDRLGDVSETAHEARFQRDRAFRAACKRARIVDLHWHDLRHEYASRLADKGIRLDVIQKLLGHASIETTMRYLNHHDDQLDDAARALGAFSLPPITVLAQGKDTTTKGDKAA